MNNTQSHSTQSAASAESRVRSFAKELKELYEAHAKPLHDDTDRLDLELNDK
jgi:hypothetical protein